MNAVDPLPPETVALISGADFWTLNSSGGKDSQAMLAAVVAYADSIGYPRTRMIVVHANLGRVEWPGVPELVAEHAAHYGLRMGVARRRTAEGAFQDLLQHVEARGRWPSPTNRYCTSDHKRDPLANIIRRLDAEARSVHPHRECHQPTIINCIGLRAGESPARARRQAFALDTRLTTRTRSVYQWLPVHKWSAEQVWEAVREAGTRVHRAYGLGMPRLSCQFCIYAPKAALLRAGRLNPGLLDEYVRVEVKTGHRFRVDLALADIKAELDASPDAGTDIPPDWMM